MALCILASCDHVICWQVKVRGQRVELEEVESALKGCPGVAEAAVLLADDRDEAVLVAFLCHKVGMDEQPG